jgi:hypothetical protein
MCVNFGVGVNPMRVFCWLFAFAGEEGEDRAIGFGGLLAINGSINRILPKTA